MVVLAITLTPPHKLLFTFLDRAAASVWVQGWGQLGPHSQASFCNPPLGGNSCLVLVICLVQETNHFGHFRPRGEFGVVQQVLDGR